MPLCRHCKILMTATCTSYRIGRNGSHGGTSYQCPKCGETCIDRGGLNGVDWGDRWKIPLKKSLEEMRKREAEKKAKR